MTCVTCLQHGRDFCLEHCEYKFDMPKAINGRFQCPICGQSNNTGSSHCVECGRYFNKLWKCNAPNKGLQMTDNKWAEEKADSIVKEWLESVRNPIGLGNRISRALLEAKRRGYERCRKNAIDKIKSFDDGYDPDVVEAIEELKED